MTTKQACVIGVLAVLAWALFIAVAYLISAIAYDLGVFLCNYHLLCGR